MAMGYLTRGRGDWETPLNYPGESVTRAGGGPVLISAHPLNQYPFETIEAKKPLHDVLPVVDQAPAFLTRAVYYFDQKISSRNQSEQTLKVKEAILQYGAVSTYMNGSFDSSNWNEGTRTSPGTYYEKDKTTHNSHALTIIGWDDNIQVRDAPNRGAWLVQNSWGNDWPADHSGTFYAAYDDVHIGKDGVAAYVMEEKGRFSDRVLQNELGPIYPGGQSNNPLGIHRLFVEEPFQKAVSLLNTTTLDLALGAVGISSFSASAEATIRFYTAWQEGPQNLLDAWTMTVIFDEIGYTLFDLLLPLELQMLDLLVVEIEYVTVGDDTAIPYIASENPAMGLSYFYDEGSWIDFASIEASGVFFLKGYTLVPEPAVVALLIGGLTIMLVIARRKRRFH